MEFKQYLINEEKGYLGHKVSDVLTSMQDVQTDMENLGSRHLIRMAEEIVNQIRKIIHSQWEPRNHKYLKELQKIAVAIQKTIDEKGDLKEILPSVVQNMQDLSGKLGIKVNNLKAPPDMGGEDIGQQDFQLTGNGPAPKPVQGDPMQGQDPTQMGTPSPMVGMPGM